MTIYDYFLLWFDAYQVPYELKKNNGIALTFDDGPHPVHTPKLLSLLAEYKVKATFFIVGQQAKAYPEIVKKIVNAGHELGNHSWSHGFSLLQSQTRQYVEIEKTQKLLYELTGLRPQWYRPPYGILGLGAKNILRHLELKPMLWTQSLWDYKCQTAITLKQYFKKGIDKTPCVLLMHDGTCHVKYKNRQSTINMLESQLQDLFDQGKLCLTLSNIFD